MSFAVGLRCRECGTTYPTEARYSCDECFGPLEVAYDLEAAKKVVTRERIAAGPASIWRYHDLLPDIFEQLDGATELLLPDDLLTEQSVAEGFRTEISDEDCASVELLGWLYQFYISEKKDQVMARKAAVPTADIPAVTQLFTPHWIVRYLVENSLGRLWLLNRPHSRLREKMPYFIADDSPSPTGVGEGGRRPDEGRRGEHS